MMTEKSALNRRDFIKKSVVAGAGSATVLSAMNCQSHSHESVAMMTTEPLPSVRIGFVGIGGMGSVHVKNLLEIEGAEIKAVGDIVRAKVERAQNWVEAAGFPRPEGYSRGEYDFRRMCARDDLDLIFTATPWKWHVPICLQAMNSGKHAATEVPAAITVEDCWKLVHTSERTRKHCVMMENCCYGRSELMLLNMVRKGLLGELVHAEGGYLHDLRAIKFSDHGEGLWRLQHSVNRNGNLYPTHGLGPLAQCMNINRGDRFDFMVSMSSKARGLNLYAEHVLPDDHPKAQHHYRLGDVNSSLIRTVNGITIILIHDCNLPRPYSRINLLQGTQGIFRGYPDRVYIEGRTPGHAYESAEGTYQKYDHPLYKSLATRGEGRGHGSMDYIEDYRLIQCLLQGSPPDMNVYDAAAWSAVSELSERSVANKSRPVDFPDFTRGEWQKTPPLGIVNV